MKLYIQVMFVMWRRVVLRQNTGEVLRKFAEKMGVVYIKLTQMLAMQNYGEIFTEDDRQKLVEICDDCNPISFREIQRILKREYGDDLRGIFAEIEETPIGSASVSQVHRARLKTGEDVAIKVKRPDVASGIAKDVVILKKMMRRFGKWVKFRNFTGGERALDLYLKWIYEETDFEHEQRNIKFYGDFADNVNGRGAGTTSIMVPKLYSEFCTENILVMEFVSYPTISKIKFTRQERVKVSQALNSYIRSSFWALLNDQPVVFHGDPHGGNVCVDEEGNMWFLDMGLLCIMTPEETKMCREFFLAAYMGDDEKLFEILVDYGDMDLHKRQKFREDCGRFCETVKGKDITYYFLDMMNVCLEYEFVPLDFLFSMAKAFVCINGISNLAKNNCEAISLLKCQVMEFMLKRSVRDVMQIARDGIEVIPKVWDRFGACDIVGVMNQLASNVQIQSDLQGMMTHCREIIKLAGMREGSKVNVYF